jgi:hypothetical protein
VVETEIEMVRRHVQEGEAHVRDQRRMVMYFRDNGYDAVEAERLLVNFERLQDAHVAHLNRLLSNSN